MPHRIAKTRCEEVLELSKLYSSRQHQLGTSNELLWLEPNCNAEDMLNSKFGLRQAANVVSAASDQLGSSTSSTLVNNTTSDDANQSTAELYVIAKYDYQSQGPQELSIKKGDRLLLIDDSRHWWRVLNSENLTGFVPSNYVKREKQSLFDSIRLGIRVNPKSKKTFSNQSPSSCPLISAEDIKSISPVQEKKFSFAQSITNSKKLSDNDHLNSICVGNSNNNYNKQQPQSNSDILVRELGPNFNNNALTSSAKKSQDNNQDLRSNNTLNSAIASVKYSYKAQQPDELSLSKGTKISVLEKSDDGWWKGELGGQVGWFPSNYVIEQTHQDSYTEDNQNKIESTLASPIKPTPSQQQTALANPYRSRNHLNDNHSVIETFHHGHLDEIGGNLNNLKTNQNVNQFRDKRKDDNNEREVLFVVVALYSFQSQNDEELSFTKDEHLDIIEKPVNDPDWWKAYNQLGEVGLVPKNYVQIVSNVESIRSWSTKSRGNEVMTTRAAGRNFSDHSGFLGLKAEVQSTERQSNALATNNYGTEPVDLGRGVVAESIDEAGQTVSLAELARDLEIKLHLNEKVWYHGVMSRQQCDSLLNAYAEDGDFLIRNSETSAGDFSVSLKAPVRNKHFRVHYVNDGFCIGQRKFDSLDELVEHYKRTPIYTSATGEKMFLKKPYCQ